jgi:hypothetical protein
MNPPCPYCQRELPRVPKGKSACPLCKKPIYVRRSPGSEPEFILLTEADAHAHTYRKTLNVTPEEIAEAEKSLPKWFRGWSSSDVLWSVLNRRVQELMKAVASNKDADQPLSQLSVLHQHMARFAFEEGKDPTPIRREAARMGLRHWQLAVEKGLLDPDKTRVCIIACETSCDACQKAAEHEFTLNEWLERNPLPVASCTTDQKDRPVGWCRCSSGLTFV